MTVASIAPSSGVGIEELQLWLALVREARLIAGKEAALRVWRASPLPPLQAYGATPASHPSQREDPLAVRAFLSELCEATGSSSDRLAATELRRLYSGWCKGAGRAAVGDRTFYRALAVAADDWACPSNGLSMWRHKASTMFYAGIRLRRCTP